MARRPPITRVPKPIGARSKRQSRRINRAVEKVAAEVRLPEMADYHPGSDPPAPDRDDVYLSAENFYVQAPPKFAYKGTGHTVFDEEAKIRYLVNFARNGRKVLARNAAGVCAEVVAAHLRQDAEFKRLHDEAWQVYCDRVVAMTNKLAFEGTWEPVIGRVARDQDGILGWRRKIEYRALEAEQRRCVPEYRPHAVLDVNARVGVLVVRQPPSAAGWEEQYGQDGLLTADPLEGIEGAEQAMAGSKLDPNELEGDGAPALEDQT